MFVIVVGGGMIGRHLVNLLKADNHQVVLVDKDAERCEVLRHDLGVNVVCGDGNDPEVLRQADIEHADGLAAVTGEDEDNLVIGLLGRREFGVPRIVGRINNPRNEWLFSKRMGIDAAVNPAGVIAHLMEEEVTTGALATLMKLRRGNLSLVETVVTEGAPVTQKTLAEVRLPANAVIAAVIRDSTVFVPTRDTVLAVGDEVVALTDPQAAPTLSTALTGQ